MGDVIAFRPRAAAGQLPDRAESAPAPPTAPSRRSAAEPLWREVTGRVLREARHRRAQTLAEVAARAGVSMPYLSEIERGRKEPSSEVLAAVAGALDLTLTELTVATLRLLAPLDLTADRRPGSRPSGPVALAV